MSTEIGTNIKRIREFKNYTQNYMADKLGISQNVYSKMENNISPITINRLEEIAMVFEMHIEEIILGKVNILHPDMLNDTCASCIKQYLVDRNEENEIKMKATIEILKGQLEYMKVQNEGLTKLLLMLGVDKN